MLLFLLNKCVIAEKEKNSGAVMSNEAPVKCVQHNSLNVIDFKTARKCKNCLRLTRSVSLISMSSVMSTASITSY